MWEGSRRETGPYPDWAESDHGQHLPLPAPGRLARPERKMFARHVCQLEGASPLSNSMEVKD